MSELQYSTSILVPAQSLPFLHSPPQPTPPLTCLTALTPAAHVEPEARVVLVERGVKKEGYSEQEEENKTENKREKERVRVCSVDL